MRAKLLTATICVALIAITWAVFGQTLGHQFVNYDDNVFVVDNPNVNHGLTLRGLWLAFAGFEADNWHPLTTISHMLDCQLFGLRAAGHHFTNVLLHSVAVVLLFVVLYQTTSGLSSPLDESVQLADRTGGIWPSAFVAAVFAIHPLRVESVAWIAERKDVLSGMFFMLTLLAYLHYVRRPSVGRYIAMSILFALGLMSKPMLVTLPIVLLFLDYWPLKRIGNVATFWSSVIEKIPLLVLSIGSSIATIFAQRTGFTRLETLPFTWRAANALRSYCVYIWQMFWPTNLAVLYPHPGKPGFWELAAAAVLLISITAGALIFRRKRPYLVTGWFWYLIMLGPVIGLIQVGEQSHADRYTYLPQIGLYLAVSWSVVDILASWRYRHEILACSSAIIIGALAWCAWIQTSFWRDGAILWKHALAVTGENDIARLGLGGFFLQDRRVDEAITQFRAVLARHPQYPDANFQLAAALVEKGELESAIEHYRKVVAAGSDTTTVHCALGDALLRQGKLDEALNEYDRALKINPANSKAETALANALLEHERSEEAIEHYRNVLRRQPSSAVAHYNLAVGLHRQGHLDEAILHYRKALTIQPDYPDADYFLGQALLQNGQPDEAKTHLEKH